MEKFPALTQALRNHAVAVPWNPSYVNIDIKKEGNNAAQVLDQFTPSQKADYVTGYQQRTGFPNMELTAFKIADHFRSAITAGATALRTQVVFAGYDSTCSVAKGKALPGSDIDFLTVVVDGDNDSANMLYAETVNRLDPAIADLRSLTPYSVVDLNRLLAYRPEFLMSNGRYIMEAGLSWSRRLIDHEVATEIISQIQEGAALIDNMLPELKESFEGKRVYNFVERHSINVDKEKSKYRERVGLCKEFSGLSVEEQFVIIRILQDINEGIPLNLFLSADNPYSPLLRNLVDKDILRYKSYRENNQVIVPWEHDSENARVLKPANWHPQEGTKVMSKWS